MKSSINHKWSRSFKRKIHINDEVWTYRIGGETVVIRSPNGRNTFTTDIYEINGTTRDEWNGDPEDEWALCEFHLPNVPPREIKTFILDKCL
jgi:hypothetical protein